MTIEQETKIILQKNSNKLLKKGIQIESLDFLGSGTMGVAYGFGDKVLKITKDVREAQASNIVKGSKIPNIIEIYDVWAFSEPQWYGILMEKLRPLTEEEQESLTKAIVDTRFTYFLHKNNDDWNLAMKELAKYTMGKLLNKAYTLYPDAKAIGMEDPRVQKIIKDGVSETIAQFKKIEQEYKIKDLFKTLKGLGIQYYDFHGGNFGVRNDGTLVLFDLGRSISKGTTPKELLEKFKLLEQYAKRRHRS